MENLTYRAKLAFREEKGHCRRLDRLHSAAIEELGLRRLVSNDSKQVAVERVLGYDVNSPGA